MLTIHLIEYCRVWILAIPKVALSCYSYYTGEINAGEKYSHSISSNLTILCCSPIRKWYCTGRAGVKVCVLGSCLFVDRYVINQQ